MTGVQTAARRSSARQTFLDGPMTSFYLVLGAGAALVVLGLVMVLSASSVDYLIEGKSAYSGVARQAMWVAIGVPAAWVGLRLRPVSYRWLCGPTLIISTVLLAVVLVPGIGYQVYGSRRWFDLGALLLQPSEIAKFAFALWGADLLVRKQKLLGEWRHLLVPLIPVFVLLSALVMLEPDLGTTMCFVLIVFALLWTVGAPGRVFTTMAALALSGVVLLIVAEPYRLARVKTLFDPTADTGGAGLQAIRGIYALATGGWWGVGLGNSRMKWGLLPNGESDYIFAIIGEELGFIGCLVVLALFATLAYAGLRIATRATDPFIRYASAAVTTWLIGQALINIGYVVGLLPVTGIPLPLISAGGTSMVLTMFILGMLAGFARHEPQAVAHLKTTGQGRMARLFFLPVPRSAVDSPRRRVRPVPVQRRTHAGHPVNRPPGPRRPVTLPTTGRS